MSKMAKLTLTFMICGGTIALFFAIMLVLLQLTGWFVFAIGLLIYFLEIELKMIWRSNYSEDYTVIKANKPSRRGRRGH